MRRTWPRKPAQRTAADTNVGGSPDTNWYKQDVLDMLRDDMSEQEVYNAMHDRITDAE